MDTHLDNYAESCTSTHIRSLVLVKAVCLVLSAVGIANMGVAIFADVGVMVVAVINATRALRLKNKTE